VEEACDWLNDIQYLTLEAFLLSQLDFSVDSHSHEAYSESEKTLGEKDVETFGIRIVTCSVKLPDKREKTVNKLDYLSSRY
jgi:hypothetical protein